MYVAEEQEHMYRLNTLSLHPLSPSSLYLCLSLLYSSSLVFVFLSSSPHSLSLPSVSSLCSLSPTLISFSSHSLLHSLFFFPKDGYNENHTHNMNP